MVGVCAGSRCAALWRLRDGGCGPRHDPLDTVGLSAVRQVIAGTPGGVLTRLGCVGACAQAPLVGVTHRRPDAATTGQISWVVAADEPPRHAGLLSWLRQDWTRGPAVPPAGLLPALFRMVRVGAEDEEVAADGRH